jgi:hypothetical protein
MQDWTIQEVGQWLEAIGLARYRQLFETNHIDGSYLMACLNDPSLLDGLIESKGHRFTLKKNMESAVTSSSSSSSSSPLPLPTRSGNAPPKVLLPHVGCTRSWLTPQRRMFLLVQGQQQKSDAHKRKKGL